MAIIVVVFDFYFVAVVAVTVIVCGCHCIGLCVMPVGSVQIAFAMMFQVALVTWTESVGLTLLKRDLSSMTLRTPDSRLMHFTILQMFPFTSESKRMGIVVRVLVPFFSVTEKFIQIATFQCSSLRQAVK